MSNLIFKTSPPARRRRPWWIKATVVLTPLVLLVGAWLVLDHVAGDRLDKAIAEADRTDPHWRKADLWASRATVPDAGNSALRVQMVLDRLPEQWMDKSGREWSTRTSQSFRAFRSTFAARSCSQAVR